MESNMAVFDCPHLDARVLVIHPGADIVTDEYLGDRHGATSVGDPDLSTYGEVLHGGFDQFCCPGRAIDVNRLRPLTIPGQGHQRAKARRVIVMMVCNKNGSDLSDIDTSFRKTTRSAVAGINNIMRSVDG